MTEPQYSQVAKILIRSSQANSSLSAQEETITREYYLNIIENKELSFQEKTDRLVDELGTELGTQLNYAPAPEGDVLTYYPTPQYEIGEVSSPSITTIGRYRKNHIVLKFQEISRINTLIFVYRDYIVILDSWSSMGTRCTNLLTGKMQYSLRDQRSLITFPRKTSIAVQISNRDIILNPVPCIFCFNAPRQVRFNCHHAVICEGCFLKMQERPNFNPITCPVCNTSINVISQGYYAQTFASSPQV